MRCKYNLHSWQVDTGFCNQFLLRFVIHDTVFHMIENCIIKITINDKDDIMIIEILIPLWQKVK